MKKKFLNLILTSLCISCLAFPSVTSFAAENTDISIEENTSDDVSDVENDDTLDTSEVSDEIIENTDEAVEAESVETNIEENTESTSENSIDTDAIFTTTSTEKNGGIMIDGEVIDKTVWVNITTSSDKESSLTKGTKFVVTFESNTLSNWSKSVTLDMDHNFAASVELPADEYLITSYAMIKGEPSKAHLIIDNEEDNLMFTENTDIHFTIKGDITSSTTDEPEVIEEVKEEKETNFWLDLLKNNVVFLILLLGCGGFLIFYKLRQDAE